MAIAGQIEYKVTVDTSGLSKGLNDAKGKMKSFADTIGAYGRAGAKIFGGALIAGATTATTAIIGVGQSAVRSYADYEQLSGGIKKLFAETTKEVKAFEKEYGKTWDELINSEEGFTTTADEVLGNAMNAFETAGMSANHYMEIVSGFSASLMQSTKNSWEAMEVADTAIQDMADNMNTFGTSMESIQNAYQGFAKGNYTMLDNLKLGYGGTKTEMERLLADAQKITGVKYDISHLDDVYNAIHVIQEEQHIAGTTANEAATTISGSLGMMKASWENLMTGIADKDANVGVLIENFTKSLKTFVGNIMPVAKQALSGAVSLVAELAPMFINELASILPELLPAIINATVLLMQAIVDNLPTLIQVFIDNIPLIADGLVQIVVALIPLLPQILGQLANAIITTIVSLLVSLAPHIGKAFADIFSGVGSFFENVLSFFGDFADNAIKGFSTFGANIHKGLTDIGKWFADVFQGAYNFVTGIFSNIGNFFKGVWDKIASIFTGIGKTIGSAVEGAFKATVNGVLSFIEGFVNTPINILNNFIDAINWAFGFIGVNLGKIGTISLPRMATGGIVPSTNGGQLILAGEGGQDEWVVPESKMASLIEQIQQNGGEGIGNVTINVYGTFATSETEQRRVAEQIYEKLQEINKARMGVYL